ncbi:hypothetical protein D915_005081 [Fasciola hepatica]|uniref:Serine-threonine/tyrosine-protein kinase catalytic domain-containing protein n=1 Tax=Fasciola hepatica TaxID=6192 RepID=A0A4E0R612_FASHE|nr:hypothetical protein D915_005081 [Fasciola hepatica]
MRGVEPPYEPRMCFFYERPCYMCLCSVNKLSTVFQEFGLDHQQLPVPASCPNWLFQIAVDCCTVEHRKRPTAAEVIERLTVLLSAHSTAATTTDLAGVLGPNYSIDHTAHSVNPALLLNGSSELSSVTKGQVHSVDA